MKQHALSATLAAMVMLFAMTGCGGGEPLPPEDPAASGEPAEADPPEAEQAPEEPAFDIASVPLSDAPLGDFPYFTLPDGYVTNDKLSSTIEVGRFPFWVGDHYVAVQGRIHQANIRVVEGKTFSAIEVEKSIRQMIVGAGGVELTNMVIPAAASADVLTREFTLDFSNGLCWPSEPVRTYVVHRTDKDIWVHACTYGGIGGAWVIAETAADEPEAKVLASDDLSAAIDDKGKVAVQINFRSGSAEILPGSQPQLVQIDALLRERPNLRLSVNGHTDNTGTAERNQELSTLRAEAVVAELRALGTDVSRLEARGLGRAQPVADNSTAEGRASNRRVELVSIAPVPDRQP
ncbi:OmpA family protein [Lysobacter sp. F6437]|uniref:OmpA family protein n=1 Tax=Lysobacter sp. F6437 TaxID=3459296 RepID=UPI00403D5EF4